jgi:hypothetical protein
MAVDTCTRPTGGTVATCQALLVSNEQSQFVSPESYNSIPRVVSLLAVVVVALAELIASKFHGLRSKAQTYTSDIPKRSLTTLHVKMKTTFLVSTCPLVSNHGLR